MYEESLPEKIGRILGKFAKPAYLVAGVIAVAVLFYAYEFASFEDVSVKVTVLDKSTSQPVQANLSLFANNQLTAYAEADANGVAELQVRVSRGASLLVKARAPGFLPGQVGVSGKQSTRLFLEPETRAVPLPSQETGEAKTIDFLVVSNKEKLLGKYGEEIAGRVEARMLELARATEREGLDSRVFFLNASGEDAVVNEVRALVDAFAPKYLFIVGGQDIVPFTEFETPLKKASETKAFAFLTQSDPLIPSDNAFGVLSAASYSCNECFPDVAVGRLPDGLSEPGEEQSPSSVIVDLLDKTIRAHSLQPGSGKTVTLVSQDAFGEHLQLVYKDNELVRSPPAYAYSYAEGDDAGALGRLTQIISAIAEKPLVFLSLHGSMPPGSQAFFSSDELSDYLVASPELEAFRQARYDGQFIVSDACYGASPFRREGESLALLFLNNGALGFVGSTTSALAARKVSREDYADEESLLSLGSSTAFTYVVVRELRGGARVGDAVKAARRELNPLNPADRLTALQYVLFGDPTLKMK